MNNEQTKRNRRTEEQMNRGTEEQENRRSEAALHPQSLVMPRNEASQTLALKALALLNLRV
jgi:hypothetical protein